VRRGLGGADSNKVETAPQSGGMLLCELKSVDTTFWSEVRLLFTAKREVAEMRSREEEEEQ